MNINLPATTVLILSAVFDCFFREIPNWLTLPSLAIVLTQKIIYSPDNFYVFFLGPVLIGIIWWPLWQLKIIGGGDHKLLLVSGALVGVELVFRVSILTMLMGGLMALADRIFGMVFKRNRQSGGESLPYGVAIAAATIITLWQSKI